MRPLLGLPSWKYSPPSQSGSLKVIQTEISKQNLVAYMCLIIKRVIVPLFTLSLSLLQVVNKLWHFDHSSFIAAGTLKEIARYG